MSLIIHLSSLFHFSDPIKKMIKTLEKLCIESFFTCKKTKLSSSYYCLFSYINVLMNKREIYFLCKNTSNDICLNYPKTITYCKHCRRLEIYNKLFQKIENEKKGKHSN